MIKAPHLIGGVIGAAVVGVAIFLSGGAEAARCALIESGALKRLEFFEVACPPNPAGKPQFVWKPSPVVTPPSFDPVTQVRTGPTYVVGANSVTESYEVRSKTAQELDDDKTAKVNEMNLAVFKALCHLKNEVRTKVDSMSAWTDAQCRNAFKNLLP